MLKKILVGAVLLIGVLVVVVMMQPSTYHVERSTQINAPADLIWAEVADFKQWKNWSHWEKSDPSQKTTITGAMGSVGHKTSWQGDKTGKGEMIVTAADKPKHLAIDLMFVEPMASVATTDFRIVSEGEAAKITWTMDGKNDFVGKFFGLVMGMEEMIGSAYDEGLANMKVIVEDKAKARAGTMAVAEPATDEKDAPAAEEK